jgi:N-methylhydantoinase A/oxoprolinase/acetone carboxylase beta subunit
VSPSATCVIACGALAVDLRHRARCLGLDLEFHFLEAGLHDRPDRLHATLQAAIDLASEGERFRRIVVGYGICGRGTVGIQSQGIPLALPRVHDCIALFLGGDAAYQRQFREFPGTYYLSAGWCESKTVSMDERRRWAHFGHTRLDFDDLAARYGPEAARQTFAFLNSWQRHYQRAAFIDTGAPSAPRHERLAREMAAEYGWAYARLPGDPALIDGLLTAEATTPAVLVVPPRHAIAFDPLSGTLEAHPLWAPDTPTPPPIEAAGDPAAEEALQAGVRVGLGIDAGGTYTDTVVYDLEAQRVLGKNKALTTRWDFTLGIGAALDGLDPAALGRVEMVALSTTLATNAIVEGEGQKVGLILMPPFGRLEPGDIPHEPQAVVAGQLAIGGEELAPVETAEVRRVVRRMVDHDGVRAFAVSGFAGSINPAHELAVKAVIREETGLFVTCGHELSDLLNFRVRAHTAVLNARIIPRLAKLLLDLEQVLTARGIQAPVVVVKGDGTLMNACLARERPVETILSGPAASVAGARHLTGLRDALVVDMGGTTTDTAVLTDGAVGLCARGARVGGQATHVKALAIRTAGLGGDSLVGLENDAFFIGPRRVAPMAWLGRHHPEAKQALDYLEGHLNRYAASSRDMQVLALTGTTDHLDLTPRETRLVRLLAQRPHALEELVDRLGVFLPSALGLERLEEQAVVQRCGLTPTDLLHVTGRFTRWDRPLAERAASLVARLAGIPVPTLADRLLDLVVERLALEVLKRQLDAETDPEVLHTCPVCRTLLGNLMSGGNRDYAVQIRLNRPVVGIGAPIGLFLPRAAAALGARAVLPADADVANAIGAITSHVVVHRQMRIAPDQCGGFTIEGLPGGRHFQDFPEADRVAREELTRLVREQARAAGTSARNVRLEVEDQLPPAAGGKAVFLGRVIRASLSGLPDRAWCATPQAAASPPRHPAVALTAGTAEGAEAPPGTGINPAAGSRRRPPPRRRRSPRG